jgi:hypothetical protein
VPREELHARRSNFDRGSGWKLEPAEYEVTLFFPSC